MSRFNYRDLTPSERREALGQLVELFTETKTEEKTRYILERLLTESEIIMLVRRLQVAELLVGGRTYEQIQKKLGVSMSTIRKIDGWLTDAAREYGEIRRENQKRIRNERAKQRAKERRKRPESTVPGTLEHTIRHDSRFVILRLLSGDF